MTAPITDREFDGLMARFAPFEHAPVLAVGVSGGADSLCLVHLADRWARAWGGRVVALTIDHKLRAAAADEAVQVAAWMKDAAIEHHILESDCGTQLDDRNVQAAARELRFSLLERWCRDHGVLHLMMAHHRDDQVETVLQRLGRGSGVHGLAAIVPDRSARHVRILRPLLDVPRGKLAATLQDRDVDWIDDPSNRDPRYGRTRLRQALSVIARDDQQISTRIAHTAGAMRRSRRILDRQIDRILARAATVSPMGFAIVDGPALLAGDRDLAARGLGLLVAMIGGAPHPPRRESMVLWLEKFAIADGGGATLAGAQLTRWRDRWLVHREPAAIAPPVTLYPGATISWDGRFECELAVTAELPVEIGALGRPAELTSAQRHGLAKFPAPVQSGLPAARMLDDSVWIPHLNTGRDGPTALYSALKVAFSPPRPMSDPIGPGALARRGDERSGLDYNGA